jgi:hypothetical protein
MSPRGGREGPRNGRTCWAMSLRTLVTAPLAFLAAILAHWVGFGGGHVLGGGHGGQVLAIGLGGPAALALAALVWLGLTQPDRRRGEQSVRAMLPGGGLLGTIGILAASAAAAFAGIEALEERSPFVGLVSLAALAASAVLVALVTRLAAYWIAAAGALIALAGAPAPCGTARLCPLAPAPAPRTRSFDFAAASRGRAPPLLA